MVGTQDAEDLTQQVFVQVFRNLQNYAGSARFETWVYRIATNEALQFLRKERRWKFQRLSEDPMNENPSEQDALDDSELLNVALQRIAPELRSIFLLREVEKLSYREIAEASSVPQGTVGSRLNRARRELQQHLIDLGWEA